MRKAYKQAEKITSQHSKSFYFASGLLPEEKRAAVRALYAFCRTVDDIVDETPDAERDCKLDYWRAMVEAASFEDNDLIAAAWADTLTRYHIPRHYALQLIDGVARDLSQVRYQTFEELATYCYGAASTVGLMSMYIVGFKSNEAIPYAIKLGVALQMTNILRDVGEDARRGRVYLPQEDLHRFGLSDEDILAGRRDERFRRLMRFEIGCANALYREAWPGIGMLNRDGRLAIAAAAEIYRGILGKIGANEYDVFNRRAYVPLAEKLLILLQVRRRLREFQG